MKLQKVWLIAGMIVFSLVTSINVSAKSVSSLDQTDILNSSNDSTAMVTESSKIHGREIYGLSTETSVIKSLKTENYYSKKYGIYMSPNEEAKLEERFAIQDKVVPKLKDDVLAMYGRDAFLGMYIDQKNGGVVNIALRKGTHTPLIKSENLIATKYGSDLPINFYEAKYSESDLDRIMDDINNNIDILSKQINIQYANVDFINQKITVGIKDNGTPIAEASKVISDLLKQDETLFNVKVVDENFKTSDEARYTTQSPILNGLVIDSSAGTLGNCSVGFSAIDSSSNPYIVTAGHCWSSLGTGIYQGSNYIGHVSKRHYGNNADAEAIAVSSNTLLSNKLYGTTTLLTSVQVAGNDVLGERVCKSGMHGDSCGTLLGKNNSGYWGANDTWFDNLRVSNYESSSGDSGATIYDGKTLKGIHKGTLPENGVNYRVYSHVTNVSSRLNLTPVNWLSQ
ncbi:S1 family peptidase [Solibacillus sp. FSL H8-0523]|uniref:S1 family peptidase n=1 Tax=Solibacillus sp. FSL H8-0523 TaxID=2954511 RepID=UPI003101892C